MTFPTLTTRVAFTTDPLAAPSWTTLSNRLERLHIATGRQADTDEVQPGTASAVMDNSDRALDPNHATGPYYGNLKPRKRISYQATIGGTTYDLYYGFIRGYPQTAFRPPRMSSCDLNATDWFGYLAGIGYSASVWAKTVMAIPLIFRPNLWWRLGELPRSTSVADSSLQGNTATASNALQFSTTGAIANDTNPAATIPAGGSSSPFITLTAGHNANGYIGTSDFTVAFWYKGAPDSGSVNLIQQGPSAGGLLLGRSWSVDLVTSGANAQPVFTTTSTLAAATTAAPAAATLYAEANNWHFVVATRAADGLRIYWDGTLASFTADATPDSIADAAITVNWLGAAALVIDEILMWTIALTATDVTNLYSAGATPWTGDTTGARIGRILDDIGVLAADRNIATGLTTLGSATSSDDALQTMRLVNTTEAGELYVNHCDAGKIRFRDRHALITATQSTTVQATFTDDPTAVGAYRFEPDGLVLDAQSEQLLYNEASVDWVGGTVSYTDTTSKTAHGQRTLPVRTLLTTATEADDRAHWLVTHYKDPVDRLSSLTLDPAADNTLWTPCLSLQLGDLVRFRLLPQNTGAAMTLDMHIAGITHDIAEGVNQWLTTFYLVPTSTQLYWILGTSVLGTSTRLAS